MNVLPDDPHSFTKDSIRDLVLASPANLSSPMTASVSCGRSGMSFERSGKNRRSRNLGPSRKRSSVVLRTRASIALGATAPRRVTRIWLRLRPQAEAVAVSIPIQVVAGRGEPFEHRLHVGQVDVRVADRGSDLGEGRLGLVLALAAVGFHEDRGRHLLVEPVFADRFAGFLVELLGVGVFLPGDVGRHGDRELVRPELLEDGVAEGLIVEGSGAERDERLARRLLVFLAVGP